VVSSIIQLRQPLSSSLFPYTTLFRSWAYEPLQSTQSYRKRFFSKNALYKRSIERLTDLRALLVYRSQNGHTTGFRNNLTYIYARSEEHTSELQSRFDLVCRLLLEKNN